MKDWPFDQAPNVAAITSTHIIKDCLPILLVTHYEDDHSWGFQSGRTVTTAEAQIVSMEEIIRIDPTLCEIADLMPGWSASRRAVGEEWIRKKDEWDGDEQ